MLKLTLDGQLAALPWECSGLLGTIWWPDLITAAGFLVRFPSFQGQSARVLSPDHEAARRIQRKLVWPLEQLPLQP